MESIEALADRGVFLWRCSCCSQVLATPDKPKRRVCPACLLQRRREQQRDHARRVRGSDLSPRACACCSEVFTPTRSDARCCSAKCRAKLSRQAKV